MNTHLPSILLFTDSDVFAGTERHILELALGLRALGHRVTVGCPIPGVLATRAAAEGFDVAPIPKGHTPDLAAIRRLFLLLAAERVDIIHAHNGRTALSAASAVTLARRGVAVATQHFLTPNHATASGLKRSLTGAVHKAVNFALAGQIAISHAVAAAAADRGECEPGQLTVIHNGISDLPPPAASAAAIRAEFSISTAAPMLLCPARLELEKDVATLITALKTVHASHPGAVCVVAGEGAQRAALQQQITDLGLTSAVHLAGFRNDIPSLMHAADLVVLPAPAEPFGLVILEAMAAAKPVIATRAGGPLEILEDSRSGLLVTPGDPAAFAAAISSLLSDPARTAAIGAAARARYTALFTAEVMAKKTSALYARALGRPAPVAASASAA